MTTRRRLQPLRPRIQQADLRTARPASASSSRLLGSSWLVLRAKVLRRDPMCVLCTAKGLVSVSVVADHVIPVALNGPSELWNLQGLCQACHDAKSAGESRARADGSAMPVEVSTPTRKEDDFPGFS